MQEILFICTGNTCRSPMAEAIANSIFVKNGMDFKAFSRGVNVIVPSRAADNAIAAMNLLYHLDLDMHVARQVKEDDINKAHKIIGMTKSHKNYLSMVYPEHKDKIFSLYGLAGKEAKDIKDPYGMDLFVYQACAEEINVVLREIFVK